MSRIAVALVALLLTAAGCSSGSEPSAQSSAGPSSVAPTPLSELRTDTMTVARTAFCARVAPGAVEDALGATPDSSDSWANGDRARLTDGPGGVTDVAHEFGCRWAAADGTTASAWVFAPPVTPGQAGRLRRAAATAPGCHPVPGAPDFGSPSVAVRCADGTTSFHGLFGDAWLSCSLGADLERVSRWCVAVAEAATA